MRVIAGRYSGYAIEPVYFGKDYIDCLKFKKKWSNTIVVPALEILELKESPFAFVEFVYKDGRSSLVELENHKNDPDAARRMVRSLITALDEAKDPASLRSRLAEAKSKVHEPIDTQHLAYSAGKAIHEWSQRLKRKPLWVWVVVLLVVIGVIKINM